MLTAPLAPTLIVVPWNDPVVEAIGYDARSSYVELFWLGTLGPTSTWLLRRMVSGFDSYPEGYELDLEQTASAMGLSLTAGVHSPFGKALNRCIMFGVAQLCGRGIAVRRTVPPLARRQLLKLPPHLQEAHAEWMRRGEPQSQRMLRAQEIADAMIRAGDEPHQLERQLLSVGIPPREASHVAQQYAPA
jgi:hypothetical protein